MIKKPLKIALFGNERYFGDFPPLDHADLRTVIEYFRRGKDPKLSQDRLDKVSSAIELHSTLGSVDGLKELIISYKNERNTKFNPDEYYCKDRAVAYHQHNSTSQFGLTRFVNSLLSIENQKFPIIIEQGCGSGLSTTAIRSQIKGSLIFAADYSSGMLSVGQKHFGIEKTKLETNEKKRKKLSNNGPIDWLKLDMSQHLPFRESFLADGIVSIGALHYLFSDNSANNQSGYDRLKTCITSSLRSLKVGSRAVFQFFPPRKDGQEANGVKADDDLSSLELLDNVIYDVKSTLSAHSIAVESKFFVDIPHHTKATRWAFVVERQSEKNDSKLKSEHSNCHMMMKTIGGSRAIACPLSAGDFASLQRCEDHETWLKDEHCRFAYQQLRKHRRFVLDGTAFIEEVDTRLWDEFSFIFEEKGNCLDTLKDNSNKIIAMLHGHKEDPVNVEAAIKRGRDTEYLGAESEETLVKRRLVS